MSGVGSEPMREYVEWMAAQRCEKSPIYGLTQCGDCSTCRARAALAQQTPHAAGGELREALDYRKLESLLCKCAQILDVVKQEWGAEDSWSSWDQSVRDEITETQRALLAAQTSPAAGEGLRMLDGKFGITNGGKLVKASSGEEIPEWEPLHIMRARDRLSLPLLRMYREISVNDGCNEYHLSMVDAQIERFEKFEREHPEWMKQPGITKGAVFVPAAEHPQPAAKGERLCVATARALTQLDQYFVCILRAGHDGPHRGEWADGTKHEWAAEHPQPAPERKVSTMVAKHPPVIQVNAPMCDKCGKIFLDCQCSTIHEVAGPAPEGERE